MSRRRSPKCSAVAGRLGRRLAPDHARMARIRAHQHRRALGLCAADRRALSDAPAQRPDAAAASTASSTSCSRTAASIRWQSTSKIPITMVESGPASGFWGAAELGKLIGEPNVLALDIGGTTAKCSLIENGEVKIKTDYWIERDRSLGRLSDHGAGGRPGRDRQWRRLDRLGRRFRQAACRPAIGRRRARAGRLWPRRHRGDDHRRQSLRSAASTRTISAAATIVADMAAVEAALDGGRRKARRRRRSRRRAASSASPTTT